MSEPALRDFDGVEGEVELDGHIDALETFSESLRPDQVTRLWSLLSALGGADNQLVDYGASFDLS